MHTQECEKCWGEKKKKKLAQKGETILASQKKERTCVGAQRQRRQLDAGETH